LYPCAQKKEDRRVTLRRGGKEKKKNLRRGHQFLSFSGRGAKRGVGDAKVVTKGKKKKRNAAGSLALYRLNTKERADYEKGERICSCFIFESTSSLPSLRKKEKGGVSGRKRSAVRGQGIGLCVR